MLPLVGEQPTEPCPVLVLTIFVHRPGRLFLIQLLALLY